MSIFIQYAGGPSLKSLGIDISTPDSLFGTVATTYLQTTVASTVFELDATRSDSTDGSSQTWSNRTAVPADSAAQTDYDFYRGANSTATTDDPTFNGSAGSAAAYWSFDGGDFFSLKSGANTTFLNNLHKTTGGADFWIAIACYVPNSGNGGFINTRSTSDATIEGVDTGFLQTGVALNASADGRAINLRQRGDTAAVSQTLRSGFTGATPILTVLSHKHSTNETFFYINGSKETYAQTFNATTDSAGLAMRIGDNITAKLSSGTRLYAIAMGNVAVTDGIEAAIRTYFETAHARSYTFTAPADLSATVSTTVFQIDANMPESVPVVDTAADVLNVVASPADGSAQAAYDFDNVGTLAVNLSLPYDSYIASVTSGYLRMSGAATAFAKGLHKTTDAQDFWIAFAGKHDGTSAADTFFATASALAAGGEGVVIRTDTSEDFTLSSAGTLTTSSAASAITGLASGSATDFLLVLSYSHSGNNWRVAFNAATFTNNAHTFATSIVDGGKITLFAENDGGDAQATDNFKCRGFAMGNSYIDDTELAKIVTWYEANHNINYVA